MTAPARHALETFANPQRERDYTIRLVLPEFTCLCPQTGQPDFATLELEYVPHLLCLELKSLKRYLWSYRDHGAFHEAVSNQIAGDLATLLAPRFLRLTARFNVRGGIHASVVVERRQPDWQPAAAVKLP
jgi:7-cyano-7-deazaguanine reductase